jgi:GNAT superfamily N-acetyltransferase
VELCRAEAWLTFASDPDRSHRALTNSGVTTLVATDADAVVGFICVLSDGEVQAYITAIAVQASHRRRGIGSALVTRALRSAGGERLDVLSESRHFYPSIPHRRLGGFRLYPPGTIAERYTAATTNAFHRRTAVPVAVVTGPVGVGKSTIGRLVGHHLSGASVAHAVVDLDWLSASWPRPADDPWNEEMARRNLASMWANFRAGGAERLVLCRVLEARRLLEGVRHAVPAAECTVIRLRAPLEVLHARIRGRQTDVAWYLEAATRLATTMEKPDLADHVVDTGGRTPEDVAAEVVDLLGWISPA